MRKNSSKQFDRNGSSSPLVHLEYNHPTATEVCIAGTFNDWRPEATPMIGLGHGRWMKQLTLPPGVYEYRFVADGNWMPDPLASEITPNPFGGVNCLLYTSPSPRD